jgi:hypothetical protein
VAFGSGFLRDSLTPERGELQLDEEIEDEEGQA